MTALFASIGPAGSAFLTPPRHVWRGKVPDEQLRRVTGPKPLAMSDNYGHATIEHLADVKAAQEKMFAET